MAFSRTKALQSLPAGLIERLQEQFTPSEFESVLRGFAVERLPVLRLNPLVGAPQETLINLKNANVLLEKIPALPFAYLVKNRQEKFLLELPAMQQGRCLLQGLSSQLPVHFLAPKLGEKIWDMCAAPGSKTTQLAALLGENGEIIASELDQIRFQKLQNTVAIQKCQSIVRTIHADATRLAQDFPEYFAAILFDAPCSAEGRISLAEASTYGFWSQKNIVAHAKLQRRLLRAAVKALKKGGRLLYSTCTLAPEENEGIVSWALAEFSEILRHVPLRAGDFAPLIREQNNCLQILPQDKAEGFFLSAFQKK